MKNIEKIGHCRYLIPKGFREGMRTTGKIFADETLLNSIKKDQTLDQIANVAMLPGIVGESLAMPDAHQGYGFCIGGVAAMDPDEGAVSAGGVGFDINCGVRLLATPFSIRDIKPRLKELLEELFKTVPCGAGREGWLKLDRKELDKVLKEGAKWCLKNRFGSEADLECIEEEGTITPADPDAISDRAKSRGIRQLGTLGSGNHFLEIQVVEDTFDDEIAKVFGLRKDSIVLLIHTGSRGLGHQVCADYLDLMQKGMKKYNINLSDRQLASVPIRSKEGTEYLKAMGGAANFAFCNRQLITYQTRAVFKKILKSGDLPLVYDVSHNIAKFEKHKTERGEREVLVHRKGATRAFPKSRPEVTEKYRSVGQPVLIPGSMGASSYVLVGSETSMQESFGSTCHGAGRAMSRKRAGRGKSANDLINELRAKGIEVIGASKRGLTEESPDAYKDIESVTGVVDSVGLSKKVAKLRPIGVIKG